MSTQLKLRRGTTAQHSTFTGASGEITVDTSKKTLVVHDGSTAGGVPLAVDSGVVHTTGNETVGGTKTFSANPVINAGTANGVAYLNGSKVLTTGSALTFDGSNLGIGTSSPAFKLQVTNTAASAFASVVSVNTGTAGLLLGDTDSATVGRIEYDNAGNFMALYTNGSERLRLSADGNLGLGVTPSAWTNGRIALQIGGSTVAGLGFAGAISETYTNAYVNSGVYKYFTTGPAGLFDFNNAASGGFSWRTAPSGTAGNAITFTQAMTLDASGRLGVGTTTPGSVLHITGSNGFFAQFLNSANSSGEGVVIGSGSGLGRISSNGASTALTLETNATERARIDSSGNLLVNTTSQLAAGRICLAFSGSTNQGWVSNDTGGGSGSQHMRFLSAGTNVGNINTTTTATSYATSSDYRLKENVQPMTGALAKVAALKPCTYKWKADGSDGEGFIAHELAEVVPQCVTGEKDAVDAEGNPVYQGIDTSFLVATLTAAIQEQQAIIEQLKADVAALKGN